MMADWCWQEQPVFEMAQILDTFGGLRFVTFVGHQEGEILDENAKERALDDLRDIAPRQWTIYYVYRHGPVYLWA